VLGNTVAARTIVHADTGLAFTRQTLLRLGIVLYGLRVTVQDIAHVGMGGVLIDALVLGSTFAIACTVGVRWRSMDRQTAMLIGAGSAICGAAAVMATQPVVRARPGQVAVAVATVVLFGTVAVFLYPLLHELNRAWPLVGAGEAGFGVYAGSTIHEMAQVVAAAGMVGGSAADTAIIAKMVRVMMLGPFLIALSAWMTRDAAGVGASVLPLKVPLFPFAFIAVVLSNSLHRLPPSTTTLITEIDTALLAMAMAALGLSTRLSAIREAGIKPVVLAAILFGWLVVGGALINHLLGS
jgi:uncharacterized integral membrane protein (TIGR00698 family)